MTRANAPRKPSQESRSLTSEATALARAGAAVADDGAVEIGAGSFAIFVSSAASRCCLLLTVEFADQTSSTRPATAASMTPPAPASNGFGRAVAPAEILVALRSVGSRLTALISVLDSKSY